MAHQILELDNDTGRKMETFSYKDISEFFYIRFNRPSSVGTKKIFP